MPSSPSTRIASPASDAGSQTAVHVVVTPLALAVRSRGVASRQVGGMLGSARSTRPSTNGRVKAIS